ncbi:hypothetical protein BDV18DRAFT_118442 [Aspergillus unguis]
MSSRDTHQAGSTSKKVGKRRAAPYGQACLHCFKTKSKCVRHGNSDSCERCLRLKKDCSSADSLRKRAAQKSSDADSAALIANLQAQNEDLNALLNKVVQSSTSPGTLREIIDARQQQEIGNDQKRAPEENVSGPPPPASEASATSSDEWRLHPEQEQMRLTIFRERMLPFLAFMHLPSRLTGQRLREEKPLLYQAIMAVTAVSIQERRTRGNELKKTLIQKSMEGVESSLELLLCVLTYVGWGYDTFVNKVSNSSPSRIMQLAMAVAYDLRVKTSGFKGHYLFPVDVMVPEQRDTGKGEDAVPQILESERAILGCFYLSSMTASHYHRMEPMRWTAQTEEYLNAIVGAKQYPTDEMFSLQVRLQVLVQQVSDQRDQRELDRCQALATSTPSSSSEPLLNRWYLEALQKKLNEAKSFIPENLKDNEILLSQVHYTSLSIHETVQPVSPEATETSSLNVASALDERDCHYHTLQAIRSFFGNLHGFPPTSWAAFPFHLWAQAIRCTSVLFRLSLNPNHRDEVRNTVDVLSAVDYISERVKEAAICAGETAPDDLFNYLHRVSRGMHKYIASKLEPPPAPGPEQPGPQTTVPFMETPAYGNDIGMVDPNQITMMQWLWLTNPNGAPGMPYNPSIYYSTY